MKNKSTIFISLLLFSTLSAIDTKMELSQGYRRDNLDIQSANKHFKAKDHFKHVDVYTTRLTATVSDNDFFLRGMAGFGDIMDGRLNSHYSTKGLFKDKFKSHSHVNGNYNADFLIEFGKIFHLQNDWKIAPKLGYSAFIQKFHTGHGHVKSHKGVHTPKQDYKAMWYSPLVGVDVQKALNESVDVLLAYNFLFPMNYNATGHFNTSKKHRSKFDQENRAYKSFGNVATAGVQWNFAEGWSLKPEFEVMKFYAKNGSSDYRFKKATRSAYECRLTLGYSF